MPLRLAAAAAAWLLAAPALAGEVRGTVRFTGPAPRPAAIEVGRDRSACGSAAPDESLLVAGGRLANAVVVVRGAPARPPAAPLVLDQERCRFVPHVQAGPAGSTLEIVNSDPVLHNVHGYLGPATAFNLALPVRKQKATRKLDRPGVVRVKCDVHGWMSAFVFVADGPSAVSGPDGAFAIPDVPPGTWTVSAWHERLGERSAQVVVPAAGGAAVEFSFGP